MTNEYYNATANTPPPDTRSNPLIYTGAEFAKVAVGFDKLPSMSSADRYRALRVKSDQTGLAFGLGIQEAVEPANYSVAAAATLRDFPTLHSMRMDANSYYRIDGAIPFQMGAVAGWPRFRMRFSPGPTRANGFGMAGSRDTIGAVFFSWLFSAAGLGAAIGYDAAEAASGAYNVIEFSGIIASPSSTSTLRMSVSGGNLAFTVLAGASIKLTKLYEVS